MIHQQNLLKENGIGCFIVPKPFVFSSNWIKTREKLLDSILFIADVTKVWKEVKLEQVIYSISKGEKSKKYQSLIRKMNSQEIKYIGEIDKQLCSTFGFIISGVSAEEINLLLLDIVQPIMKAIEI